MRGRRNGKDVTDDVEHIRIALADLVNELDVKVTMAKVGARPARRHLSADTAPVLTPPLSHTVIEERKGRMSGGTRKSVETRRLKK